MVPNIIHFVFGLSEDFGGKPFSFVHYMAIKSAIKVNNPSEVILHYEYEPKGLYWDMIKSEISLNQIVAPTEIHGNLLNHVAHKSDIIRLQTLYKIGGIYLDMDTICVKPIHKLRKYNFVMGTEADPPVEYTLMQKIKKVVKHQTLRPFRENVKGLCNAVILSEPGAEFIRVWLDSYSTFRSAGTDQFWSEHSVSIPYKLSKDFPSLVKVLNPFAFHYPIYDDMGLKLLFE